MSGDGRKAWLGRHKSAFALRLAIRTVPFLVVVFGLLWLNRRVGTPPSLSFAILQWIAPSSPALAVLIVLYWVTRRLLPLALLLQLSLAFPDVAPSRFRTSMRRNTTRQLQRDLDAGRLEDTTRNRPLNTCWCS